MAQVTGLNYGVQQEGFLGRHWVSEDESLEKSKMKRWMENLRGLEPATR